VRLAIDHDEYFLHTDPFREKGGASAAGEGPRQADGDQAVRRLAAHRRVGRQPTGHHLGEPRLADAGGMQARTPWR
jgi:hypothetical protein